MPEHANPKGVPRFWSNIDPELIEIKPIRNICAFFSKAFGGVSKPMGNDDLVERKFPSFKDDFSRGVPVFDVLDEIKAFPADWMRGPCHP